MHINCNYFTSECFYPSVSRTLLITETRTTVIILYRPCVLRGTGEATKADGWQQRSRQKAKTAATNINNVMEKLIDLDMIKFLKPMS